MFFFRSIPFIVVCKLNAIPSATDLTAARIPSFCWMGFWSPVRSGRTNKAFARNKRGRMRPDIFGWLDDLAEVYKSGDTHHLVYDFGLCLASGLKMPTHIVKAAMAAMQKHRDDLLADLENLFASAVELRAQLSYYDEGKDGLLGGIIQELAVYSALAWVDPSLSPYLKKAEDYLLRYQNEFKPLEEYFKQDWHGLGDLGIHPWWLE